MGFSGASAGFGLGMAAGVTLLAVEVWELGGGERAEVTFLAGGGGLEVELCVALERAREAFNSSFVEMDVVASGEEGDLGEVGMTVVPDLEGEGLTLELDLGEVGLTLELDFGVVGLLLEAEEPEVDRTASLTEETT